MLDKAAKRPTTPAKEAKKLPTKQPTEGSAVESSCPLPALKPVSLQEDLDLPKMCWKSTLDQLELTVAFATVPPWSTPNVLPAIYSPKMRQWIFEAKAQEEAKGVPLVGMKTCTNAFYFKMNLPDVPVVEKIVKPEMLELGGCVFKWTVWQPDEEIKGRLGMILTLDSTLFLTIAARLEEAEASK